MSKTLKASLNTKDISSLIKKLEKLDKEINKLPNKVSKEVAKVGLEYLQEEYSLTDTDQTIDIGSIKTSIETNGNTCNIIAEGKDVIYAEFGTGERGADDGHPWKNSVNISLNPYNSGDFVRTHINKNTGRHFWWYNGYSEGNPSGKQFLHTSEYLQKEGIKEVGDRLVGDVLSKL